MTEQDFITSMRVLFSVWKGTENADQILTDVVATIGSQCFGKHGLELRALEAECGSAMRAEYQVPVEDDESYDRRHQPPPALKAEVERNIRNAVSMGKAWDKVFDSVFSPKR